MDANIWVGVGRLTKDPVFFPGRKGQDYCTFVLAVNRLVANAEGPQTDYLPCSLWGEEAKRFVELRSKGDTIGVRGALRTSRAQRPDGRTEFFFEVRVEEVTYGMRSMKNLSPRPADTAATRSVRQLSKEFSR